ncbi:MAG TPA: SDR family NAD(P)-dependent oxidoreductase [Pseudonocardiaceae bacterium]|nr:SDR family NAD(P)-dependent oxidoreductase [Pseudonocardiaceae bacterium]
MDLHLGGKRAIVTGGSRGIGFAAAAALAAEGADVAIVARNQEALDDAAFRLTRHGHRVLPVVADTADDESVRAMVALVVEEFGGVDILVNAAAQPASPGASGGVATTDDDVRREVETKVLGYLRCARAVAPHMVEQGWGRIVNVSGLAARQTSSVAGSLRNVAVAALTKNLADELGPSGVNVTVVHPGITVTERTPGVIAGMAAARGISEADAEAALCANVSIGRMVTAAEIGDVIAFLASPRSVPITGDAVAVGGGAKGAIHY